MSEVRHEPREPVDVEERKPFKASDIARRKRDQQGLCALCPEPLDVFICDHRVPRALGGETTYENLQLICLACDGRKTPLDRKRIAKAQRLARDSDPATRRRSPFRLRGRGFGGKDPLR